MKKILIGVLIASSFAVSGDLAKCTEAINMMDLFFGKDLESFKKWSDLNSMKQTDDVKRDREYYSKRNNFYRNLTELWRAKAETECKGVLNENDYKIAVNWGVPKRF